MHLGAQSRVAGRSSASRSVVTREADLTVYVAAVHQLSDKQLEAFHGDVLHVVEIVTRDN
jgi:hypothetical protein